MNFNLLDTIYDLFSDWAKDNSFYCSKGCSTCCTQNVSLTTLEARRIAHFLVENNTVDKISNKLDSSSGVKGPHQSTNQYVQEILTGKAGEEEPVDLSRSCPFLEDNICSIYAVRPFSCRCFSSNVPCSQSTSAEVPQHYLLGSLAVMQILEHLDHPRNWGYLTDMLLVILNTPEFQHQKTTCENPHKNKSQSALLTSQKISGFFLPESEKKKIAPLLQSIFGCSVGVTTIGQILKIENILHEKER